jgi:choloylglycine hydrolase
MLRSTFVRLTATALLVVSSVTAVLACTGISLKSRDGSVVVARTVEWALGDAHHDTLAVFPRGHSFTGQTPDGYNGLRWQGKYGFISLAAYDQPYGPDGLNEAGLYVGMYYFPDFASFSVYEKAQAEKSLSVGDFMQWMLSNFATVKDLRSKLESVIVVNVEDPRFGGAPLPFHWKIADPSGDTIIIEITGRGKLQVYDAFMGVVTNSPGYDWHLVNLRNYLGLSPEPRTPIEIDGRRFAPLGSGSGLRGLPGDFTPPSRFVRAVALTASVRPLETTQDAVFEAFRILDSFNIPIGATAGAEKIARDIDSATQITTASDLKNGKIYFHTMSDRQVRMLDLKKIDFSRVRHQLVTVGASRQQSVKEVMIYAQ